MDINGRVENGVVVPSPGASLPEGAEVVISVRDDSGKGQDRLPDAERKRIRDEMDRIAALSRDLPNDGFSGADHDRLLYGNP